MTMSSSNQQPEKMSGESLDISEQRKRELKQLFPGVFTETTNDKGDVVETIDFERLKAELGTFSDVYEGRRERYGMEWPGKRDCMRLIQEPSRATLKPVREESVDFDTTQNLFIEGDNLEVLKLLQKSYYGKVKMIYIDPPYNTGKEFIYPDKYSESLDTYLSYAGLVDDEGRKFSTNTATEGRFHTKWLNMMYPRLYLSRNLLRDDGVIFISIDDNEVENLRRMCDEIFGEENFMCTFAWQKRYSPPPDTADIGYEHESIVMYRRSFEFNANLLPLTEEQRSRYKNPDNDPRGSWKAMDYTCRYTSDERPNLYYPIVNPNTGEKIWPNKTRVWAMSREVTEKNLEENRIWWGASGSNSTPALKNFLTEIKQGRTPSSLLLYRDVGHTDEASKEFRALIPEVKFTSKPTRLLKHLFELSVDEDDIVLDFFAGSCTTSDALYQRIAESGSNNRYIVVQLPEPCGEKTDAFHAGYKTIAEIGKERIRRAAKKIRKEREGQLALDGKGELDLGFKVLKLEQSNFKQWQAKAVELNIDQLSQQLELHTDHIDPFATQEEILYELLLKSGFMPTEKVETIDFHGSQVFAVAGGALLICLEDELDAELIDAIADLEPMQFICLDKAFKGNDQLKANAIQTFKSRSQNAETEMVFKVV